VIDKKTWQEVKRIPVAGQPIFIRVRPDQRQMWVNFALPNNEKVQVLDIESLQIIKTLEIGKAVLHLEFTPRGEEIWLSVRDENKLVVYNTETLLETASLPAEKPSGIFLTVRAHYIGL
jgi:protein NirF